MEFWENFKKLHNITILVKTLDRIKLLMKSLNTMSLSI